MKNLKRTNLLLRSITPLIVLFLLLGVYTADAQETSNGPRMQVGFSGLPIFYMDDGFASGLRGYAFYGNVGWYHSPSLVFGLRPFYGKVEFYNETNTSAGMNVYIRKYLTKKRFKLFLDVNAGLGYIEYDEYVDPFSSFYPDYNGVLFNFALGPGVDIGFKNNWHLELLVQYLEMQNISYPDETTTGRTVIPTIGVQKFF